MREAARRVMRELGADIEPDRIVGALSGGQRQLVAVARALQFRAATAAAGRADGRPLQREDPRADGLDRAVEDAAASPS